jgi:hypothetical protein
MRVTVETMPALLGAGARFVLAGALLCLLVVARRGPRGIRVGRREAGGALLTGTLLMGANATVMAAEQEVPSSLAALLIASVPLWVLIYRTFAGERVGRAGVGALVLGFAGVALLLLPGDGGRSQAPLLGLVVVLGAAAFWALGSFTTSRVTLPADPLASTGWQMLFGGTGVPGGGADRRRGGRGRPRRLLHALAGGLRLPRRVRIGDRLQRLRLAAAQRAAGPGRHLRLRQPRGRDRARGRGPRRDDHGADAGGRRGGRRLGRAGGPPRGAAARGRGV